MVERPARSTCSTLVSGICRKRVPCAWNASASPVHRKEYLALALTPPTRGRERRGRARLGARARRRRSRSSPDPPEHPLQHRAHQRVVRAAEDHGVHARRDPAARNSRAPPLPALRRTARRRAGPGSAARGRDTRRRRGRHAGRPPRRPARRPRESTVAGVASRPMRPLRVTATACAASGLTTPMTSTPSVVSQHPLLQRRQRRGGHRVAGDDQQLGPPRDQLLGDVHPEARLQLLHAALTVREALRRRPLWPPGSMDGLLRPERTTSTWATAPRFPYGERTAGARGRFGMDIAEELLAPARQAARRGLQLDDRGRAAGAAAAHAGDDARRRRHRRRRPEAAQAVTMTRNGRIGLLATPATVASGAYARAVARGRPARRPRRRRRAPTSRR